MDKILWAALALIASCGVRPAYAARTCDLSLTMNGSRLEAHLAFSGIANCPTSGSVMVEWTSPDKWFKSSTCEAHWRSCVQDVGTARTWCYRTVDLRDEDGKHHRAKGTWKVVVYVGSYVLAEGSYEVR